MSDGYVCPECGLDYDTISPSDAVVAVRSYPRRFREVTALDGAADRDRLLRTRPAPETWSALEYVCHVNDVFGILAEAIRRMTVEDHPTLGFGDPDQLAIDARYAEQDPDEALDRLGAAAEGLADAIAKVGGDDWKRTGAFPWGDRDILAMTRNAVHEGKHHLRDVELGLQKVRGEG